MLKVTFLWLRDPIFQDAMRRLYATPDMPVGIAYKIGKLCGSVQKELDSANRLWTKIVESHCERNPDGSIVMDPEKGKGFFKIQDTKAESFRKAVEEFNDTVSEVEGTALTLDQIKDVKLSPAHLDVLLNSGLVIEGTAPKAVPLPKKRKPGKP